MREMLLNHASVLVNDRYAAINCLKDLAQGMSSLRVQRVVNNEIKMSLHAHEITCSDGFTLSDAILNLRNAGFRDEYLYMSRLALKAPLIDVIGDSARERFQRCEASGLEMIGLLPEDASPLLYCAITNGIAISFPLDPVWDQDQIDVYFDELSPDGDEISQAVETIDNLSRVEHAEAIADRHIVNTRIVSTASDLWERRREIFPNLQFGIDVEHHLENMNAAVLRDLVRRLSILDAKTHDWVQGKDSGPPWRGIVRDESDSVYNDPSLRERRRYRSSSGNPELYMLHSNLVQRRRIHLRSDGNVRLIEIGYVGQHLPTKKFR